MVDVAHGDCYIIDLFNEDEHRDPRKADQWITYLVDTGPKSDARKT